MPQTPSENGFTLIELMVVISIIAGVIAMSMPYLSSRNSKNKAALRELSVLSRELHTKAKLQGVVYRLVLNLQEESSGKRPRQTYWVEKANAKTVLKANEEEEAFKRAQETDESKKKDPQGFEIDKTFFKGQRELPEGLTFEKIEISRLASPVTHGRAFIHYLPQGLVDEAAIHIKGEKEQAWTISIHPVTGKGEVIAKPVSLKEIKSQ